ncbi:MAG: hypothetical protein KDJ37_03715 [Hyphomicrobiaceae bacterium]|nr:hypothetical protein [Hyphomicrobiaceae bacterium]
MYDQVERRARRLKDMIHRTGANSSRLVRHRGGATIAEASRNCLVCPHPTACLEWLDDPSLADPAPPPFCANCALLSEFRDHAEGEAPP